MNTPGRMADRTGLAGGRHKRPSAFRHDANGVVSVEFALLMAPFLLLLVSVIEFGALLHAEASLQHATEKAGRLIRTGQVTGSTGESLMSADAFVERLCADAPALSNCQQSLSIDVRSENSFAQLSLSMPEPVDLGPAEPDGGPVISFSPGGASEATSLVVTYDWKLSLAAISPIGNVHGGKTRRLQAIAVFRNEPF
jgi:Flp pilus assembly protein TadG